MTITDPENLLNIPTDEICKAYHLGQATGAPTQVFGGLLHTMWRITTNKNGNLNNYAVKQLSSHIDLNNTSIQQNYELTEKIAKKFADNGIPAIYALTKHQSNEHLLNINGTFYLIYPWLNAKETNPSNNTEPSSTQSEERAIKIVTLLAKIHAINLPQQSPERPMSSPYERLPSTIKYHQSKDIEKTIESVIKRHANLTSILKEKEALLISINERFIQSIPILENNHCFSHGDLDPKNVLWDQDENPYLIDWESARPVNPTYDLINVCLDWSNIGTHFSLKCFREMIKSYQLTMGSDTTIPTQTAYAAIDGILGNWIDWLMHNLTLSMTELSLEKLKQHQKQISNTIDIIVKINTLKTVLF